MSNPMAYWKFTWKNSANTNDLGILVAVCISLSSFIGVRISKSNTYYYLRGTILIRTYGTHKTYLGYISLFLLTVVLVYLL